MEYFQDHENKVIGLLTIMPIVKNLQTMGVDIQMHLNILYPDFIRDLLFIYIK